MTNDGNEWRFVLMRNMELDPNIPQTFQIRAREPVGALLEQWATKNKLSVSEFAFFSESGQSIEDCSSISDLPLLAPGLNYVDIKCVKTKATVFQVYGFSRYRTSVKITMSITFEELENRIRNAIPCLKKRRFHLLSEGLRPFSRTKPMVEQMRGESRMCWIDLEHTIKCLDLKLCEINVFELYGTASVKCLLSPDSPKSQNLVYFDKEHKALVIDEQLCIADLPTEGITETEFSVLRVTQQTVFVDDPCAENLELLPVDVWPTDEVRTLSSHLPHKRRIRHGEVRNVYFDGERLDPTMLFCDITDSECTPILHLSKAIEILYCDQSTGTHSVCLNSCAPVSELRACVMKKFKRCNDEIVLKYNGLLLDCDNALLYEYNIRDGSLIHVHYARFCVLVNKAEKRMNLGYHYELDYFFVFKLACQFFERSLSSNTVFTCKCGRQLSSDEDQRRLSVDCCRPRHRRMVLTAHRDVTVRFRLNQESKVFRVIARTDEMLGPVAERLCAKYPCFQRKDIQFLTNGGKVRDDVSMTLYELQKDDSESFVVPFEKKVTLQLTVKQRTFEWTIWPSAFVSTVMTDVNDVIKDLNSRSVERWICRGRKVTEPKDREYLEFLRFSHFGIQQSHNQLFLESINLKNRKHATSKREKAVPPPLSRSSPSPSLPAPRPPSPKENITIVIKDKEHRFEVWDTDSAASLCARLCNANYLWNAISVKLPKGDKIYPYEKKWFEAPVLGKGYKPTIKEKMSVDEAVSIRLIVIAICPLGSPVSFFVKSSKRTMDAVKEELLHRNLHKSDQTCWFTQVGRYFDYNTRQHHGIATVIGNSPKTYFISDTGDYSGKSFGSVTISNISSTPQEPLLTVPPFGDPKIEIYVNTVFLKAHPNPTQAPIEMGSMENCFKPEVFVYIRGIRLTRKKVLCPSLYSGRNVNSDTGVSLKTPDEEGSAENFVLVFDADSVVPKFKIPPDDDVRVFYRAGFEVTFRDGRFERKKSKREPRIENRWIADDRSKDLTKNVGRYLKSK